MHMHIVNDIAWRGSKIANAIYVMGCSEDWLSARRVAYFMFLSLLDWSP